MIALLALIALVRAADPTPGELLARYDQIMSPGTFEADSEMTAHRDDGSERTYRMTVLRGDEDKLRVKFAEPASARGQEMLRVGDNLWIYMPNLKRAVRLANRESFMGGDFNNADVLRVNYAADYAPALADSGDVKLVLLELTAKTPSAAYDRIRLFMDRESRQPVRAEYYAKSGKLLRSAAFADVKEFKGVTRPATITMRNELATARWSVLRTMEMKAGVKPPATKFVLDDLGR